MASTTTKTDTKTTDRNKRLDLLKKAVDKWAKEETKRLEDEATFLESILKGRTGAGRLTKQNVADAQKLVVDEIDQFLTG